MEMLAAIQGARSAEFEPENFMEANKVNETEAISVDRARPVGNSRYQSPNGATGTNGVENGSQPMLGASNDSPTMISDDDDTSFSTWKAPVSLSPVRIRMLYHPFLTTRY